MRARRTIRTLIATAVGCCLPLVGASAASAAIGVVNPVAQPATTQAGAQTDLQLGFDVYEADKQLRDLVIELPPGLVGNPEAVPKCEIADFNADACAPASQIGATTVTANALLPPPFNLAPITLNGSIFNLVPQSGEPGRLGVLLNSPLPGLLPNIRSEISVALRPDFGLTTTLEGLPKQVSGINVFITSVHLNLDQVYINNPSSCAAAITRFKIRSWAAPAAPYSTGQDSFLPTGCDSQPYDPRASVTVDNGGPVVDGSRPAITSLIEQAPGEANSRRVDVTLPEGVYANTDRIFSGDVCSLADFEGGACVPSEQVGEAEAESPLLSAPLAGPVYLVDSGGELPRIGLDLGGPMALRLLGDSTLVGTRLSSSFDDLPDLPLPRFELAFSGGPDGLFIANAVLCDMPAFDAAFFSQGGRSLTQQGVATINSCPPPAAQGGVQGQTAKKCKKAKKKKRKRAKSGDAAAAKKRAKRKCKKKKKKKKKKRKA